MVDYTAGVLNIVAPITVFFDLSGARTWTAAASMFMWLKLISFSGGQEGKFKPHVSGIILSLCAPPIRPPSL